jgi:ribosomal-protein-alanine N-acetyltransferase
MRHHRDAAAPEPLRTPRLIGERLRPEHVSELQRLLLDPAVARWLWPFPEPQSRADIADILVEDVEHWHRHGFGLWLLRDRESGEMVGRGGLMLTEVDGVTLTEVAWAITPDRWGEGLATELARASLEVAFERLQLEEVVAMALRDNVASRRVMEKAGLVYERETLRAELPHVLYRLRRMEWPRSSEHPPTPLLC